MKSLFRWWFGRSTRSNARARVRRAWRRNFIRQYNVIEKLESRRLLAGHNWSTLLDQAELAGRTYASDHIAMAFQTPAEFGTREEAREYLASQSQRTPFEPLVEGFELAYSYQRANGSYLTVGDVSLPADVAVREALTTLSPLDFVEWAQPDYLVELAPELMPNDPLYREEFYSESNIPAAWDIAGTGSPEVLIAIIDTGVHWRHQDFYSEAPGTFPPPANVASNIFFNTHDPAGNGDEDQTGKVDDFVGWDFVDNDNDPSPVKGTDPQPEHGTHVAGMVAARINNAVGTVGVAGTSRILPLRVSTGTRTPVQLSRLTDALSSAVKIAEKNRPAVRHLIINISLDTDDLVGDFLYQSALDMAYEKGALVVQSAGNGGADEIGDADPDRGVLGQSLTVASLVGQNRLATYSNYGRGIDLVALGATEFTTTWDPASTTDVYDVQTGTSIAAAQVAGIAALVWSHNLNLTRDQVVERLLGTATNVDAVPGNERFAGGLGHGLVNAAAAVNPSVAIPSPTVASFRSDEARVRVLGITFSQPLDPATARLDSNYELRRKGPTGEYDQPLSIRFGTFEFPHFYYSTLTNELRLESVCSGELPPSEYRLRLNAAGPNGLRSPSGTPLTGNLDHFFKIATAEGRTGDVIEVDLKLLLGGTSFSNLEFPGYTLVVDALDDIHLQKFGSDDAKIVTTFRTHGIPTSQTGRFYLVPKTVGNVLDDDQASAGFQGTLAGRATIDGQLRDFQIVVNKGYSSEGPHAVVSGPSVLARMRAQQRLKHLGFYDLNQTELFVDGNWGPESKKAARLFNAALNGTQMNPTDPTVLEKANEYVPSTLNSLTAPRWQPIVGTFQT
ncbi:MAG: S8 family serine peptidase, partial [Pirellula sp.]